ncbi:hypothetical protein COCCADRAFT_40678 [Bipolaris zeicola 26-R-13]|uniref:Uncharacterized protein n=1 Tax=Cochliobolus carbonum (strain 26-R-13) TaxID=930089 RepID=W6XNH7_COCC2|nr:uncharacterized protein COCCADRAFT_40678 [Bipolaris zeicola 26-R-13]EUC28877.1 hypothetical protein COCCADRAFT_40678 [Bipolaris zeicola 26-R-13]
MYRIVRHDHEMVDTWKAGGSRCIGEKGREEGSYTWTGGGSAEGTGRNGRIAVSRRTRRSPEVYRGLLFWESAGAQGLGQWVAMTSACVRDSEGPGQAAAGKGDFWLGPAWRVRELEKDRMPAGRAVVQKQRGGARV